MDTEVTPIRNRIVGYAVFAGISILGVTVAIALLLPVVGLLIYPFGTDSLPRTPDPKTDFAALTGWTLPDNAKLLKADNTFSGFKGDGDYTLIVQMSDGTVQSLIEADEANQWQVCPIPTLIENHCLPPIVHSGQVYRAIKTRSTDTDWHRGTIVVANATDDVLWIYAWKH